MGKYDFIIDNMTWSYSRLNSFDDCPYAWKLNYIEENRGQDGFFGQFGSFCHYLLEKFAKNELSMFELSQVYEDEYAKHITYKAPPNKYVDLGQKYYNVGKEYFDNFTGFGEYEVIDVERKVQFMIDKYKITGYIDLIVKNKDGEIEIVDHKSKDLKARTTRKTPTKSDVELDHYLMQLYLYSIPVYESEGKYPTKLNFNAFRNGTWIQEDFKLEKLEETKQWVVDTINKIKSEDKFLPKSEQFFCWYLCSMRDRCSFKPRY
jgi:hypothetical protein